MKYKKEKIIGLGLLFIGLCFGLAILFKTSVEIENPFLLLFVGIFLFILIIIIEKQVEKNHEESKINYENVDFLRYIFSIIIIIVHLRPFLNISKGLDITFNNIVGRVCVPFFFLVTGYFIALKEKEKKGYIKKYIKSLIPLYLIWSIIYLPILFGTSIQYMQEISTYIGGLHIPEYVLPFLIILAVPAAILVGLLYTGVYYHLWYFPALIFALVILDKWKKRFPLKILLGISFLFLLFGATETYYGFFPSQIKELLSYYYNTFFTTRNFLFFGLFYVVLGYYLGSKKEVYTKYSSLKFIISIVLLIIEGLVLQTTKRLNSNILLFTLPFVYYLFKTIIYMNPIRWKYKYSMRELSKYYYFIHPAVLFFFQPFMQAKTTLFESTCTIILIISVTHIMTIFLIKIKNKYPKLRV